MKSFTNCVLFLCHKPFLIVYCVKYKPNNPQEALALPHLSHWGLWAILRNQTIAYSWTSGNSCILWTWLKVPGIDIRWKRGERWRTLICSYSEWYIKDIGSNYSCNFDTVEVLKNQLQSRLTHCNPLLPGSAAGHNAI